MYAAVAAKQSAAVQALCEVEAHAVNTADEWGLSPLHIAARAGDADIVALLLLAKVRIINSLRLFQPIARYLVGVLLARVRSCSQLLY